MVSNETMLGRVWTITSRISINLMGIKHVLEAKWDQKFKGSIIEIGKNEPRVYLQIKYWAQDHGKGRKKLWKGRKWYLSEYMTDDEIIKTAY